MKKVISLILALMLTFTLVFVVSCNNTEENSENPSSSTDTSSADSSASGDESKDDAPAQGVWQDALYLNDTELGTGKTTFTLQVVADDKTVTFTVHTDKTVLGDALTELELIEGEMGAYGLYVKKVNGILADYDVDGTYWALYINGEYGMSGVDSTELASGTTYKLSRE